MAFKMATKEEVLYCFSLKTLFCGFLEMNKKCFNCDEVFDHEPEYHVILKLFEL